MLVALGACAVIAGGTAAGLAATGSGGPAGTTGAPARAESGWSLLNMTPGVTEMSRKIYDLHMLIFWVCVAIGVIVFGVMIYSMISFRRDKGAVPDLSLIHI